MNQRDQRIASSGFQNFENFGNYILLKKLATGGMAEVFLARPATQLGNGRVQVIKRILPHVANDLSFRRMFQTEIQVCMGFSHPHTVQLHDFGDANGQPYISMEYIEGKNLKDVIFKFIEKGEMMPVPMALSLVAQAASGLSYAHTFVNKVTGEEVKAIHRDISPHNLLVNYDGNLKVIDFGIAKAASGMAEATRAGTIKGKFAYLSPEQITGQAVDARADIFALGIVAWELLTLRRPFYRNGDSEMTILGTITNCDQSVKAPSYYNGAIPPEVDEVILKALRRDPRERYSSAEEFQAALRLVLKNMYSDYTYAANGKMMQSLFAEEIEAERQEIRILNMNVQMSLSNADATVVTPEKPKTVQAPSLAGDTNTRSIADIDVDVRLRAIESIMKKKASARHYVMFAFYVVSVIFIKLDESYSFFDFLLPQGRVAATSAPQVAEKGGATPQSAAPPPRAITTVPKASNRLVQHQRPAVAPVTATAPAVRPPAPAPRVATAPRYQQRPAAKRAPATYSARSQRSKRVDPRAVKKTGPRRTVVTQDTE